MIFEGELDGLELQGRGAVYSKIIDKFQVIGLAAFVVVYLGFGDALLRPKMLALVDRFETLCQSIQMECVLKEGRG